MKLIIVLALLMQAGPIKPGKESKGAVIHREVDLRGCAWIEFKQVQFQARTNKFLGEVNVSVEHPGIADCVVIP